MTRPPIGSRARPVRIGDRERAEAAERLSVHAAAGRLSIEELEQRLERADAAVLASDLAAVEADLPSRGRGPQSARRRPLAAIAIACLVATVAASVLVGHPLPPLLLAAFLLWRTAGRAVRPTWRSQP